MNSEVLFSEKLDVLVERTLQGFPHFKVHFISCYKQLHKYLCEISRNLGSNYTGGIQQINMKFSFCIGHRMHFNAYIIN